jgi:hypothetical protein
VTGPWAADDFTAICARMEELRRERDLGPADAGLARRRSHLVGNKPSPADKLRLPIAVRRALFPVTIG